MLNKLMTNKWVLCLSVICYVWLTYLTIAGFIARSFPYTLALYFCVIMVIRTCSEIANLVIAWNKKR